MAARGASAAGGRARGCATCTPRWIAPCSKPGWHDLAARAEPIFLDETNEDDHIYQGRLFWPSDFFDEVLARLLALNAERHAEEVRLGIAPGMKGTIDVNEDVDAGDEE